MHIDLFKGKQNVPKLTLVIVGKRHHIRFYGSAKDTGAVDEKGNPKAGTIVDRVITNARAWEYYIQSHRAVLGTARSAHYTVLWDETFCEAAASLSSAVETFEKLTYNMCYLFPRSITSVSIPPAVYLADLACERARGYLHCEYGVSQPRTKSRRGKNTKAPGQTLARREALHVQRQKKVEVNKPLENSMIYI